MLEHLTDSLPYFLLTIFLLVGMIFFVIVYFSGFSLKKQFEGLGLKSSPLFKKLGWDSDNNLFWQPVFQFLEQVLDVLRIRPIGAFYDSIRAAKKALAAHIDGKDYSYKLPWFVMVGDTGSGKSSLLAQAKLPNPLISPNFGMPFDHPLMQWWFYEHGIVIDLKGSVVNGETLHKDRWHHFLLALKRYRPARPLDGIILTVPSSYFLGPDVLSADQLAKKGQELSEKLIQTEDMLGLKLPIYVLLTKCDLVGGFKGFSKELSLKSLEEIFGWSNPYTTDLSYNSAWIKEAFSSVQDFLLKSLLKIFAKKEAVVYQDDIMVFPDNFAQIESGLQTYLNAIFKEEDYRDHFILRGIYATGQQEEVPGSSEFSHLFLKDLFDKKIFQEVGVAAPFKRFLLSANRTLNIGRVGIFSTLVLGFLGTYWVQKNVSNAVDQLKPSMVNVLHSLENLNSTSQGVENISQAQSILDLIVQVGNTRTYIPTWALVADYNLKEICQFFYDKFIGDRIASNLDIKAQRLLITPLAMPSMPLDKKTVLSPTETPEFLLLEGYVKALQKLHTMTIDYNAQAFMKKIDLFAQFTAYLYDGYNLKKSLTPSSETFLQGLISDSSCKPFYLDRYNLFAEKRLYELYNNFLKRVLDPEYNAALIYKLQKTLERVEGRGVPDLDSFRNSLVEIKDVLSFITNAGGRWLTNPVFDPGSRYQKLMDTIKSIPIFTEPVYRKISDTAEKLYQKSATYLRSYGSPLTGYFLTWSSATNSLTPSEGLLKLEKGLNTFLDQPFMQKASGSKFIDRIPDGQFLYWDPNSVRNALALIENYRTFVEMDLSSYPVNLQDVLRLVGQEQLQTNIEVMLERAQTFYEVPSQNWGSQADNASQVQANNISETGPLFVKLLKTLDDIGARATYARLKSLLFTQMYSSLETIDQALTNSDFYEPVDPDFKRWNGEANGLLGAYNLSDQTEMISYFTNQSARVMSLALRHASPVVSFLKSDSFRLSIDQIKVVTRWGGLLDEAAAYDKGKTTGSMKVLEKFLEEDGNKITYDNCFTLLDPAVMNAPTGDFFLQKRNLIMKSMYKRCQQLAAEKGIAQYKKVSDYFNANLANSFPFVAIVSKDPNSDSDVSYDVLNGFFKELDLLTPDVIASIDAVAKPGHFWSHSKQFMANMREIKTFFDKYFAPIKKDGAPGLSFILKFNENKAKSLLADRLADWAFINNDKVLSLKENGNANTIRYELGTPISFGFEWMPNFPVFATKDPRDPALIPMEKRSLFVYDGTWALLRAMMLHLVSAKDGGSSINDVTLGFTIPLAPAPNGPAATNAKLYVQVVPVDTMGTTAIDFKIPKFPTSAPVLREGVL